MDLLKDITRELRGDERTTGSANGSHGGGQSRTTSTARSDSDRRDSPDETDEPTEPSDEPASDGASTERDDGDVHVCSFCETEFDASRGVCPECDAEIVLRGNR